ncbi:NAD(P)-binding protein [Serendipita vermifera]|nr:NAD(P)-binding protein [Serendipita vermifera]
MPKILITGASGMLGAATYDAFRHLSDYEVLGLAHSRPGPLFKQVDLRQEAVVNSLFSELALSEGDWVIHCAAERRPDVAENDVAGTKEINVAVPQRLAQLSAQYGFRMIYISTDYVFDGTSPPYSPQDAPNPLQLYGKSKRDGELAILETAGARGVVLRVPILYGPVNKNSESAVNVLLDIVQDQTGKTYQMDHFATRYPTNTLDIAAFLVRLIGLQKPLPSIIHYSAGEPFTKYEMCLVFAQILGVSHDHIKPISTATQDGTVRPVNTQLDVRETESLFEGTGHESLGWNGFEEWWRQHLRPN